MATLVSKTKTVNMEFVVSHRFGQTNLIVDIVNHEIIFRAFGCRTECYVEQAKTNPQRITNCILALDSNIFNNEIEQVVRAIIPELI